MADVRPPLTVRDSRLAIPFATATQDGYLTKEDFILFSGGTVVPVTSFNMRTGEVVLLEDDVLAALGYMPINKAGDTMTGALTLAGNTLPAHAATRGYVDLVASVGTLLPGEYSLSTFGASGSHLKFTGTIAAGTPTKLTLTAASDFQVGQGILIGASGSGFITKVDAIDATLKIITLHAAATAVTNANVQHDDSLAIQAAIDQVCNSGGGTIYAPPGLYRCNFPVNTYTNSILTVPFRTVTSTNQHIALRIVGTVPQPFSAFLGPASTPPAANVAVFQTDRVADATKSIFSVAIYDPDYNNVNTPNPIAVHFEDLIFRTYDNPQISGVDLAMCVQPFLRNVVIDTGLNMLDGAEPTHGTFGLRMPRNNVTYEAYTDNVVVQNYGIGVIYSEEWRSSYTAVIRCKIGLQNTFGYHPSGPCAILIWHCPTGINITDRSIVDFSLDYEVGHGPDWDDAITGRDIYDPTNKAMGFIRTHKSTGDLGGTAGAVEAISKTGCTGVTFQSLNSF